MAALERTSVFVGILVGVAVHAKETPPADSVSPDPSAIVARLKTEATKVDSFKMSPVFSMLRGRKDARNLRLSTEQSDLVRRLGELTSDIIRAWMVRDLDADLLPTATDLAVRLSDSGPRLRDRLIAGAEAIALEGILNSEQARCAFEATGQKPRPLLRGRNGPPDAVAIGDRQSHADLAESLRRQPSAYANSGPIAFALLGMPGMREEFRDGIGHLDKVGQILARRVLPKVRLTNQQFALEDRLDKLMLAVWGAWLTRDLDKQPLPPPRILTLRLGDLGARVRDSLFARADAIALEGILTPDQADRALKAVWQKFGIIALLDPTLAARLRLTRSQRETVCLLLESKKDISENYAGTVQPIWRLQFTDPEAKAQVAQLEREADDRKEQVDDLILFEVLSAPQARALARILKSAEESELSPASKSGKPRTPD
jgi:hypothetical protein